MRMIEQVGASMRLAGTLELQRALQVMKTLGKPFALRALVMFRSSKMTASTHV